MKKYFMLAIAAMALTFVSCNKSPEAKAEDYVEQMEKALKNGDLEEFAKVAQESQEWYNGLSQEDQEKVDAVLKEKGEEMLNDAAGAVKDKVEEAAEGLGEDLEDAAEDLEDAAEDLKEAVGGLFD